MKMDGFGTHQALLVAAMVATEGDIIEMGGGWYSTPLISAFSVSGGRQAYTLETGEYVYDILKRHTTERHTVSLIPGFSFSRAGQFAISPGKDPDYYISLQRDFLNDFWSHYLAKAGTSTVSVTFIDQAPGFLRVPAIQFFANKSEYIITHDTEHVAHYGYEPILSSFKFRWDFQLHRPCSTIVSNFRDCSRFGFLQPDST